MKTRPTSLSAPLALAGLAVLLVVFELSPLRAQEASTAPSADPAATSDVAASSGNNAPAGGNKDAEWPCVSRKVLEISPAQIWDGPPLEGLPNWRDDNTIRKLSEYVVSRRIPEEDVDKAIKKYADSLPEAERDQKLTLLFSGVLSRINDERKIVISGIERFHKRVAELIRAAGADGIRLNELTRRTQFIEPKLRREILLTLIESEQVIATPIQRRGRPGIIYRLAELAPGVSSIVKDTSFDVIQGLTP